MSRSSTGVIINIQILRFFAAAAVVFTHSVDLSGEGTGKTIIAAGNLENIGAAGVDIFFVISGFIIAKTGFVDRRMAPGDFLAKRLIRIVPIYYLLSLPWIARGLHQGAASDVWYATFLFWPSAGPRVVAPALEVGWTLCFEMLFYVSAAVLLALPKNRWSLAGVLFLYAASWTARELWGGAAFQFIGNPIILEFLLGSSIACFAAKITPSLARVSGVVGAAWFAAVIWVGPGLLTEQSLTLDASVSLARAVVFGVPAALLVAAALGLERHATVPGAAKELSFLGDASYSIYLIHPTVLCAVAEIMRVTVALPRDLVIVIGTLVGVTAGVAAYQWVEKPLLGDLRSLFARHKPRPA